MQIYIIYVNVVIIILPTSWIIVDNKWSNPFKSYIDGNCYLKMLWMWLCVMQQGCRNKGRFPIPKNSIIYKGNGQMIVKSAMREVRISYQPRECKGWTFTQTQKSPWNTQPFLWVLKEECERGDWRTLEAQGTVYANQCRHEDLAFAGNQNQSVCWEDKAWGDMKPGVESEGEQVLNFCSGLGLPSKGMIHVGN